MDEGVDTSCPSPRDVVLSNIRKMRPDVFILFIMNGTYSSPYFVPRFREALFHYSAMFDMMDVTTSRDSDLRVLVERDLFGQCAQNVIACEVAVAEPPGRAETAVIGSRYCQGPAGECQGQIS